MKTMLLRNLMIGCAVALLSFSCATVPANRRVSHARHPNLAEAQSFIERAINKITLAQAANDFDMAGHAAKAKSLLDQAYSEIKLAALAANR